MMTIRQLHELIKLGRYADSAYIWYELGSYYVSDDVLIDTPERVFVDTVAGYRKRHGL